MSVIQIGAFAVIGAVLAVQMKSGRAEYGVYVCIAAGVVLFAFIVERLSVFVGSVQEMLGHLDLDAGYLSVMLRMTGITYIAEFASGICKDAGCQTLAGQIEIFAKLTILSMGLPVLLALMQTIQEFLG